MGSQYRRWQFLGIGISVDEIINSPEAKQEAYLRWKQIQAVKRFEDAKLEEQYLKDCAWWEKYSQSTVRYFLKHGDNAPILRQMRKLSKWLIKNWMWWILLSFIIRLSR